MSKEQGAGFYLFKIGEFEVASVSDGFFQFDNPKTMIAAGASEEEFQAFMESKFLPSTNAFTSRSFTVCRHWKTQGSYRQRHGGAIGELALIQTHPPEKC